MQVPIVCLQTDLTDEEFWKYHSSSSMRGKVLSEKIGGLQREWSLITGQLARLEAAKSQEEGGEAGETAERVVRLIGERERAFPPTNTSGLERQLRIKQHEIENSIAVLQRLLARAQGAFEGVLEDHFLEALSRGCQMDEAFQRDVMARIYAHWNLSSSLPMSLQDIPLAMVAVRMERDAIASLLGKEEIGSLEMHEAEERFRLNEISDEALRLFDSAFPFRGRLRARLRQSIQFLEQLRGDEVSLKHEKKIYDHDRFLAIRQELLDSGMREGAQAAERFHHLYELLNRLIAEPFSHTLLCDVVEEIPSLSLNPREVSLEALIQEVQYEMAYTRNMVEEFLTQQKADLLLQRGTKTPEAILKKLQKKEGEAKKIEQQLLEIQDCLVWKQEREKRERDPLEERMRKDEERIIQELKEEKRVFPEKTTVCDQAIREIEEAQDERARCKRRIGNKAASKCRAEMTLSSGLDERPAVPMEKEEESLHALIDALRQRWQEITDLKLHHSLLDKRIELVRERE